MWRAVVRGLSMPCLTTALCAPCLSGSCLHLGGWKRPTLELPNLHATPSPLQPPHPYSPSYPPLCSLPTTITDTHLRDFFGKFGTVTAVQVLKNRESGRSRGFGFVIFVSSTQGRAGVEAGGGKGGRSGAHALPSALNVNFFCFGGTFRSKLQPFTLKPLFFSSPLSPLTST